MSSIDEREKEEQEEGITGSVFFDSFLPFDSTLPTPPSPLKKLHDEEKNAIETLMADLNSNPVDMNDSVRCRYCGFLADRAISCRRLKSFRVLQHHPYFEKLLFSSRECQKSFIALMISVPYQQKQHDYVMVDKLAKRKVLFAPSYHKLKHFPFGGAVETHEQFLKEVREDSRLSAEDLNIIHQEEKQYNDHCNFLIAGLSEMTLNGDGEKESVVVAAANSRKKFKVQVEEIE